MKSIVNLFPTVTLQAIIENHQDINQRLKNELVNLFDEKNLKRELSHKWNDYSLTNEKSSLGYTSFNDDNLVCNRNFEFYFEHLSDLITDFFQQLEYNDEWHFVNAWASVYPKGAFVPEHDHKPMHWSAAYYVKAPENCGDIIFTDPKEYALQNEPRNTQYRGCLDYRVTPEDGMLLLFPGYLKHETMPNQSSEDRIIISFNIICGSKAHADLSLQLA